MFQIINLYEMQKTYNLMLQCNFTEDCRIRINATSLESE